MGTILDEPEGSAVSAEARRESFRLTTADGDSVELAWDQLPHLKHLVMALEAHAPRCPACRGAGEIRSINAQTGRSGTRPCEACQEAT